MSTPWDIQAGSILSPILSGVCLGLFAHDTYVHAIDRKEGYVLRKLQRGLSATEIRLRDGT
jgi:hypothetical protein